MSVENTKRGGGAGKLAPASGKGTEVKPATASRGSLPPLFRKIDWLTMLLAFGVVWVVYFLTLAPEVTLEDSGELCTGSFYAGIPHPPGYPVWTIYTWLWTVLVPFGNVAWRVALGEATASALACGMVGLMVSRGTSMLLEGIEEFKSLTGKRENAICLVCGAVAGVLLGMGGVMWSESVAINRISLFGVPWVMTVLLCMLRWIYAPSQRRYLFCAMFFFGICLTIHQTLLVAAMGIEAAVASCQPRLGRTFFLGNTIIYLLGVLAFKNHLTTALDTPMILIIFHAVGIASIVAYICFALFTEETSPEFGLDAAAAMLVIGLYMTANKQGAFYFLLTLGGFIGFVVMAVKTVKLGHEWVIALICAGLWLLGAMFYFYEPIAGMTNPPMQWGYPRTVEGFWHAFTRGQYDKVNPTDIFGDPGRFITQLGMLIGNIAGEYNWMLIPVALLPLFFFRKLQKRERAWLTCLTGTYLCISVLLIILMNPSNDRASADLHQVFFASSHAVIAIFIGYGLALIMACLATHYEQFRRRAFIWGGVAALLALFCFLDVTGFFAGLSGFNGQNDTHANGLVRWFLTWANSIWGMLNWATSAIARIFEPHRYAPLLHDALKGFQNNQYGLPVFAGLILLVVPVAFLIALRVRRKAAPLALCWGLFALIPLCSGMSHWFRSEQRNHWFGYWYGHDMFSPPFAGSDGRFSYDPKLREQAMKGTNGDLVYPEMTRNAILFGGTDPGRFCPTYMIFCESFIPHSQQPIQDQNFDRRDVYIITQNALADTTYLQYIRAHYQRSAQIDPPFFREFLRGKKEIEQGFTTNFVARLAYQFLDRPFTSLGANIEARRRREGVYPAAEIIIPSGEEGRRCAVDYMQDAARRLDHDNRFPNEPKQMRPGENVTVSEGRVGYSGQVSVMSVNGMLTKLIFDRNPGNEFYEEESFPMDWMFPYLTPYGVIMKINRQPVAVLTAATIQRDHEFWSRYSERLIGNWITYDTPLKEIVDFIEKVYIQHDFAGFKGDHKFLRDDDAQRYFSHLRAGIASSIYNWRCNNTQDPEEKQRMARETDFAFRQAFAFGPFNLEVVFHYVNFLATSGHLDEALLVANTAHKLDPNNSGIDYLISNIQAARSAQSGAVISPDPSKTQNRVESLEKEARDNPDDFRAAFQLAGAYLQIQQRDKAVAELDRILANPKSDANVFMSLVQAYSQLSEVSKVELSLQKLVAVEPDSVEGWQNLAALEAALKKKPAAIQALRHCLETNSKRLAKDPKSTDVLQTIRNDPRFQSLRQSKEFQELVK